MLAALGIVLFGAVGSLMRLVEVTFTRLSRARASGLDEVDGADGRLVPLAYDRDLVLGPAVLLRVFSQVGIVAIAAVLAANRLAPIGVVLVVCATGLLVFLAIETLPQRWALERNDQSARFVAPVAVRIARFPLITIVAVPLVRVARWLGPRHIEASDPEVGEDELLAMAEAAARADVIEADEAGLIESIISLGDTIARAVMVPRPDMVTVGHTESAREAIRLVLEHGYTRVPVSGDDVDDIVGVVLAKDLMREMLAGRDDQPLDDLDIVRSFSFVPESKNVSELMREMQGSRMHMAIVVDEYGGTAGLVTLEDIIEELVGEIVDEYDDEVPLVEDLGDASFRVSGRLPIVELGDIVGTDLPEGDWDTVGGLLFDLLGHVPTEGESVRSNGHVLTAERVDGRRIDSVLIVPAPLDDDAENDVLESNRGADA